jgi:vesicle-fusing ATPase
VAENELKNFLPLTWIDWGFELTAAVDNIKSYINQVKLSNNIPLVSVCLNGPHGVGKTAIAAKLAIESEFGYVKMISPDMFVGDSEATKCRRIEQIFLDSYRSSESLIVIDELERILEFVPSGPRFSALTLTTLLILLKKAPPAEDGDDPDKPKKLMIIATSSCLNKLDDHLDLAHAFSVVTKIPSLTTGDHTNKVFEKLGVTVVDRDQKEIESKTPFPISVKDFVLVSEMARQGGESITSARFEDCLVKCGLGGFKCQDCSQALEKKTGSKGVYWACNTPDCLFTTRRPTM